VAVRPIRYFNVVHCVATYNALQHGHVKVAVGLALPTSDTANRFGINAEEHGELRDPLIQERLTMHEDERAAGTLGHQVCSDDCLADSRCGDKHANVVSEERVGGSLLHSGQLTVEVNPHWIARNSLVFDNQGHAVSV